MTMTADGTMNPRIMRDQLYVLPVIEVSDQFGLQLKSYCPLLLIPRILIFQDSKTFKDQKNVYKKCCYLIRDTSF